MKTKLYKMIQSTGTETAHKAAFLTACLFWLCSMTAMAQTTYYVKPQNYIGNGGTGTSWQDATTLNEALQQAKSGDEIHLMGFEKVDDLEKVYVVPADGFQIPSGVKIYGGFSGEAGTESQTPDDRETLTNSFEYRYVSIVAADIQKNDQYYPAGPSLIYPTGNADDLRADNAPHVFTLTSGSGTNPTEIDGLTIAAAHNTGNKPGGAVVVSGSGTYHIRNCFFLYNYAPKGGAIYVYDDAGSDASTIANCYLMNNAAGIRSSQQNDGGGIYLGGRGTIVNTIVSDNENGGILMSPQARVVNSTVTRNTAAAVELTKPSDGDIQVYNTVIWGNSALYETEENKPGMFHCAYPEADKGQADYNGNIYAGANNFDQEDQPPLFDNPSPKMGFDQNFNWQESHYPDQSYQLRHGSILIDKGAPIDELTGQGISTTVLAVLAQDPTGTSRPSGSTLDIGAYEYSQVETGHIRYVKAGGTGNGTSWNNAMGDLQSAIDELAELGGRGEVWVAAGTFRPTRQLVTGNEATVFFRMRDGISVYGGFPADVQDGMTRDELTRGDQPWVYANGGETILEGYGYDGNCTWSESNNYWTPTSQSYHVVWFAPLDENEGEFELHTELCGVTIRGGYAAGQSGTDGMGGGVYMEGERTALVNCVVKENRAKNFGGGIYLKSGRVEGSLLYNNSAMNGHGGAVYADTQGEVLRCMLSNNSAHNGGAIFMDCPTDGFPGQLTLSTCVVSNNQSIENGAVYCNRGGSVIQSIIVNNYTPRATDAAMSDASKTGGLYLYEYGLVVNSVLWNNHNGASDNAPFYAFNPATDKVRFYNSAVSGYNSAVWYNILQKDMLRLSDKNSVADADRNTTLLAPGFSIPTQQNFADEDELEAKCGIQSDWTTIDYLWQPMQGSNLRAQGLPPLAMPSGVNLTPQVDLKGDPLHNKPALGAFRIDPVQLKPEQDGATLRLYVDVSCQDPEHDGNSWERGYRSINEAINYFAGLTPAETQGINQLEIYVLQNENIYPRYTFASDDPKSATIEVPAIQSGLPLTIKGGFADNDTHDYNPLTYRSVIDGNPDRRDRGDGLYHCIYVQAGADVTFEGFHIINGNAAGEAVYLQGAGLLIEGNATVTLRNCILENLSADRGAALYGEQATVTMENCVVNNNTNATESAAVVIAGSLTLRHVTFAQNLGGTYSLYGGGTPTAENCFAADNTSGNSTVNGQALPDDFVSATNFQNPTNQRGATLGFDTYRGGYSSFRPLTSSTDAANALINQGTSTTLDHDIMGNARNLGGTPDLGAYEADLPEAGRVIYVRSYNTQWDGDREEIDGSPNMDLNTAGDGSSWEEAINGNAICDATKLNETSNDFYVVRDNELKPSSYDYDRYRSRTYGPTAGCYGDFWSNSGNYSGTYSNIITNNREERYVSGLQYAVEKASAWNKTHPADERIDVWVGAGIYTDYKGFVIRDSVRVYGGFPNTGTPGEDDRQALLSSYIPKRNQAIDERDYETIIQVRKESPVTWTNYNNGTVVNDRWMPGTSTGRHYVLYQPDVCLPTWSPENDLTNKWGANRYRYDEDPEHYVEYTRALWDGFTVRHGYLKNYKANRDGGAGVRVFRGVTLQNLVIANNYNHGSRSRGGGLYMDGRNSSISNSFIVNNLCSGDESYGGGAYMIVGIGYNMAVANNESETHGGGIFIEDATFYNNTIAYNSSTGTGGLHQYTNATYGSSSLHLYNCLFYGNDNAALGFVDVNKFNGAENCYVHSETDLEENIRSKFTNCKYGTNLASPFASADPQGENNFRLKFDSTTPDNTWCVNNGTELYDLPDTDVDFTDRIKDCRVDVGAYELDNSENIDYERSTDTEGGTTVSIATYYVTQDGRGTMSGGSLDQAACAQKLQNILDAAGEYVAGDTNRRAIVKVAGYASTDATGQSVNPFVYHPNEDDLSDPNDPQSYTYTVPYGVTLMGGYKDISATVTHWDEATDPNCRDILNYPTLLSPVVTLSDGQQVNGHHTVTFGTKPTNYSNNYETTILDGVTLMEGQATASGGDNDKGGGAIVPAWGHVRNCIVRDNQATNGGGLYLQPGSIISGTLVKENQADYGAGIYAANKYTDAEAPTQTSGTYIISSTIVGNISDDTGGGLYLEDGAAVSLNSVIWGNEASADKDISGLTETQFTDQTLWKILMGNTTSQDIYLFNNCFVQQVELPATFEQNTSMTSESNDYFADEVNYMLRAFSPLIKSGMPKKHQSALVTAKEVAEADINRLERVQKGMERLDVGAFAFDGGRLNTDNRFTRLFVAATGRDPNLSEEVTNNINDYLGRSFYTPFSHVDEALAYIREVRKTDTEARNKTFEILIAEGTYKPTYKRDNNIPPGLVNDQRLNSFNIPYGVNLYGGFSGKEGYICNENSTITEIPGITNVTWTANGDINGILAAREQNDLNTNGILEPWEMSYQSILSGNINVSVTETNAYHVIYTGTENEGMNDQSYEIPEGMAKVTLDGLTVMDGQTAQTASAEDDALEGNDVVGRGGGIYSNGVQYTLNHCRLLRNRAVMGNAIYVRDAGLRLFGSMLAGNSTVDNPDTEAQYVGGGAVMVYGGDYGLKAFNSLWANNETTGDGGAIAVFPSTAGEGTDVLLVNNTLVRNKSLEYTVAASGGNIINTLAWGNEYTNASGNRETFHHNLTAVHYSATEEEHWAEGQKPDENTDATDNHNISVSSDNGAIDGPRFASPSATAGVAGFSSADQWNPGSISILTDAGNGVVDKSQAFPASESDLPAYYNAATGDYKTYLFDQYGGENNPIRHIYMEKKDGNLYLRYSGPKDEYNQDMDRIIDIGLYEYQYNLAFDNMDTIYVAPMDAGEANGINWANATSDLRGAIVGLANSTGDQDKETITPYNAVLIRQGEYANAHTFAGGVAYSANMNSIAGQHYADALSIRGSYNEQGTQDFSKPTTIYAHPNAETATLMSINTHGREVFVEGILFHNTKEDGTQGDGILIYSGSQGKATVKNVQVRNSQNGVIVEPSSQGEQMMVNVLFADNNGTGLNVGNTIGNTTVINGTFAQNGTDYTGTATMYNSVSWNNTQQYLITDNNHNNVAFAINTPNDNILSGPNFVDPSAGVLLERDYHIRPGIMLLNKGNDTYYTDFLRTYRYPGFLKGNDLPATELPTADKAAETDLGGSARFVDVGIDVGAYEFNAPMRQIIYVDDNRIQEGDGSSWENALTDLQDAVNLAGIYADDHPEEYGYVFAQSTAGNQHSEPLNIQLGGTKVYGGMHTERYTGNSLQATDIVTDLLTQRRGMMESQGQHSTVNTLTISRATQGKNENTSVVDGFLVTNGATIEQDGMLSTSIVEGNVMTGNNGILYNSFVKGSVSETGNTPAVEAVNVTATGNINITNGANVNNRQNITAVNRYIHQQTDEAWNYQLNEEATDIDRQGNADISKYMELAGHDRDMAGNPRLLNSTPDNGCFETWSVPELATWSTADQSPSQGNAISTGKHYPVQGSVVYVNRNGQLIVGHTTETTSGTVTTPTPFTPGYLLLREGASLYSNGQNVSLPYVATERSLSKGWNLVAIPYALQRDNIRLVNTGDAETTFMALAATDSTETYNGAKRAESLFAFHESDSEFWNKSVTSFSANQGFALKTGTGGTYRFTAGTENSTDAVYSEMKDETEKIVRLTQYDQNPNDGTANFTFKENMGWNLFGLPYLVSDYDLTAKLDGTTPAMDLPHVLYLLKNGQYFTVQSWDGTTDPNGTVTSTLSFGEGAFTQTAVIGAYESLHFQRPEAPTTATGGEVNMQQYRLGLWGETGADGFVFAPTEEETDEDYTIGADGLKLMAPRTDAPQVYAVNRTGTRFSLMNAVNAAGSIQVGIRAIAGEYTMSLNETMDVATADEVWLTDRKTGTKVNLRRTDYHFTLTETTDDAARFTLSFSQISDDTAGTLNVYVRQRILYVENLREGDTVTLYTPSGTRIHTERTTDGSFRHALNPGIYLVHVSGQKSARKVLVP